AAPSIKVARLGCQSVRSSRLPRWGVEIDIFVAELIGTALLLLLGNGVVATVVLNKSYGQGGGWIVITAGWGVAVAMAVTVAGRACGAHISPAVTLALAAVESLEWRLVASYLAGQMLGAIIGATLVWLVYYPHWGETDDAAAKRACFCTAPAIAATPWNFF